MTTRKKLLKIQNSKDLNNELVDEFFSSMEKPKKETFKQYVEKYLSFPEDELQEATDYFLSKPIKTYQHRFYTEIGDPTFVFLRHKKGKSEIISKPKEKPNTVKLPTYKVEEKDPTYKLRRGKVMEAHSNLHANKDGKRVITTKMKIWDSLTPSDKEDLKKSIMLAIDHKFKGGGLNEIPKELHSIINKIDEHIGEMKHGKRGTGMFENYFKPKGMRQMIFFSDSSSSDEEPYLPIKRGRGRPKCS